MHASPTLTSVRESWITRYTVAVASTLAAFLCRLYIEHLIGGETPFLLLFAAVLVSGVFGGLGPGLLATLLGAVASNFFFMPPTMNIGWGHIPDPLRLVLFVFEGVFISVLGASLQAARRRAERSEAEARGLEQRILDVSEAERRRFGQDLHDGLGQQLTGVAFLSKALQQKLEAESRPEARDATKIAALVSESIGQARDLAKGLVPVGLEDAGLTGALRQLAIATRDVFGIECTCRQQGIEVTDLAVATHLYRISQEAVNNAIRHGKARRIDISLEAMNGQIRLLIEDDGVGFSPPPNHAGMGLQIMQFRARMVDGNLSVQPKDGGGTAVVCSAPLPTSDREPAYDHAIDDARHAQTIRPAG